MLQTSAAAVASLALLDASAPAAATRYQTTGYLRSRFTPHLGTAVDLRTGKGWGVRTTLAGVEDVANIKSLAGAQDAYVLRFRGPKTPPLPDSIVNVVSARFGSVVLFVSRAGSTAKTQDYLAVINRRIPGK
ncbi:MAG: hypothetical protein QOI73_3557 [Solirubrobacteraceae bacterium]|nr:hypothetical protein [Solirubrobacteraceae bacterium]